MGIKLYILCIDELFFDKVVDMLHVLYINGNIDIVVHMQGMYFQAN